MSTASDDPLLVLATNLYAEVVRHLTKLPPELETLPGDLARIIDLRAGQLAEEVAEREMVPEHWCDEHCP